VRLAVILLLYCLFIVIGGCVGGSKFIAPDLPPAGKALIYFYRPAELYGAVLTIEIFDGGIPFAAVKNGQFIKTVAAPGNHQFTTKKGAIDTGVEFEVEAGQTYYVRYGLRHGMWSSTMYLTRAYSEDALKELKGCCKSGEK
jgi:hypothetical protein